MSKSLIDWEIYGSLIRAYRKKAGYEDIVSFSYALKLRIGLIISKDALYRIEQGRQAPTAEQFVAINIVLFDNALPKFITELFPKSKDGRIGVCEECGSPFITKGERGHKRKFCSEKCRQRHYKKAQIGKNL